MHNQNNKKLKLHDPAYIEPFFVGLLEGDGSIIVSKRKNNSMSYFTIKLKYNSFNSNMLQHTQMHIGGVVRQESVKYGNNKIVWVASAKKDVINILNILEKYPLLSSRKICQLEYMKQCLKNRSATFLLQTRDSKYDTQQKLLQHYNKSFNIPHYFGPWLSGFIKAEGSFKNSYNCLRIGVNHDWYIINAIKDYFHSHHTISLRKSGGKGNQKMHRYNIAISSRPVLSIVIKHFEQHPLLGYKRVSYEHFEQYPLLGYKRVSYEYLVTKLEKK